MMDPVTVDPYPPEMPCAGPYAPQCEQIDELIRLLVTIRQRYGNTAIRYRVQWGGSALWAEDAEKTEISKLKKQMERLRRKVKKAVQP